MSKYEALYHTKPDALKRVSESQSGEHFGCLIDEVSGGINLYIHNEIINEFCCFLVWEKPTINLHIKDVDHVDYDGWCSLGWDVDNFSDMIENTELNNGNISAYKDICLNGVIVGKLVNPDEKEKYETFLKEWSKKYLK